jgi:hypothetical protein
VDRHPALIVGAGLIWNEIAVPGFRVYNITGGSGTVTFP